MQFSHNLDALRTYFNHQNANLRHLNSVVGGQMFNLDRTLNRISGRDPWVNHVPQLKDRPGVFEQFVDDLPGMAFSMAKGALKSQLPGIFGNGPANSRQSSGQIWTDMASSITRAISRNL